MLVSIMRENEKPFYRYTFFNVRLIGFYEIPAINSNSNLRESG